MDNIWILAQASDTQEPSGVVSETVPAEQTTTTTVPSDPNAAGPTTTRQRPAAPLQWIWIGLIFVMIYFLLFGGHRKQKRQQQKMMQSLKKNDKVRTIGGIIGTIVDIKDDEITLKVDESNNTKIKIAPSAIGRNLSKDND